MFALASPIAAILLFLILMAIGAFMVARGAAYFMIAIDRGHAVVLRWTWRCWSRCVVGILIFVYGAARLAQVTMA